MKKLGYSCCNPKERRKNIRHLQAGRQQQKIFWRRDFYATDPNQKWATDVTEFKIPGDKKKLYLSAIIGSYMIRYPVAYVVSATEMTIRLSF